MMRFPDAMSALLSGYKVRRGDWNRPSHIEMRALEGMTNLTPVMVMRDGTAGPYTPSSCDIVAADWADVPD